jgi:hypothetical protein
MAVCSAHKSGCRQGGEALAHLSGRPESYFQGSSLFGPDRIGSHLHIKIFLKMHRNGFQTRIGFELKLHAPFAYCDEYKT